MLTLNDLVALPVLTPTSPTVVHGVESVDREVRWVHTSEIYDIAPLLKGGEALLTSGLGLVGASEQLVRRYVRSLAEVGVSALLFEVGRTFHEVPDALRDEISHTDVALVILHGVTPFIDVTEAAHRLLIEHEAAALRIADQLTSEFLKVLVNSGGVKGVLDTLARFVGQPVSLISGSGQVVASTMKVRAGSPIADLPSGTDENIEVYGNIWGIVRCHGEATESITVALKRAAIALSLEMVRSGQALPARRGAQREFLSDLMSGAMVDQADVAARASSFGLVLSPGRSVVAIGLRRARDLGEGEAVARAISIAQPIVGPAIVGPLDDHIIIVGISGAIGHGLSTFAAAVRRALAEAAGAGTGSTARAGVVFSQAAVEVSAEGWSDLQRAVRAAVDALEAAHRVQLRDSVLIPAQTSVLRLLLGLDSDPRILEGFVTTHLAPVLAYDASHGTELLRTIEALQAGSRSRADAATELGISRQTLYSRIERVTDLLGPTAASDVSTYLATLAWRLRTRSHAAPSARARSADLPHQPATRPYRSDR